MKDTPANELTKELLAEVPKNFPQIRVWRNNRVKARVVGKGGEDRFVDAGVNGQADISGIIGPMGRRLEIEVKAGEDRLNENQKRFRAMILRHGGCYIEAHEVRATLAALEFEVGGTRNGKRKAAIGPAWDRRPTAESGRRRAPEAPGPCEETAGTQTIQS